MNRLLENLGFLAGISIGVFAAVQETLRACEHHPFPWALAIIAGLLIAPKMVGRSSAGRAWESVAGRVRGFTESRQRRRRRAEAEEPRDEEDGA